MKRSIYVVKVLFVLAVVVAACFFLKRELTKYSWADFQASLAAVTTGQIALTATLTLLNYIVLCGYDWIAIRYIGHQLPLVRLGVASFVGQSASLNFGSLLGGAAARFRMYSILGFRPMEVVELIAILGITYWLGALSLAATVFFVAPPEIPADWATLFTLAHCVDAIGVTLLFGLAIYVTLAIAHRAIPPLRSRRTLVLTLITAISLGTFFVARSLPPEAHEPLRHAGGLGFFLAAIVGIYLLIVTFRRDPIPMFGHSLRLPPLGITLAQIFVAAADFVIGATAFYVLFPLTAEVPYMTFLGIYLLGQVVSAFTHAPGGLGILELIVLKFVSDGGAALAPVLLFRVIYFWIPLTLAGIGFLITEFYYRKKWILPNLSTANKV